MKLTNERVVPALMDMGNGLLLEHMARYHLAGTVARGRVLDMACGVGYGGFMVARYAKKSVRELVGVDYHQETVDYAARHYGHPKCRYVCADATDPDLVERLGGRFDTILSFETIEHLEDDVGYFRNLIRLLEPGGTLVLSTPFGRGRRFPSNIDFHCFQYSPGEFRELFSAFSKVRFLTQKGLIFQPWEGDVEPAGNIGIAIATLG